MFSDRDHRYNSSPILAERNQDKTPITITIIDKGIIKNIAIITESIYKLDLNIIFE